MNKKSLYEMDQEHIILMDQLEEAEGILDETLERALEIHEGEVELKAMAYCKMIKQWEGEAAISKAEEARLAKRRKVKENSILRLKDTLSNSMKLYGKEKIEGDLFTVGFRKSTKTEKTGEGDPLEFLPKKFIKIASSVDTAAIGAALKAGETVKGFERVDHKNLSIR